MDTKAEITRVIINGKELGLNVKGFHPDNVPPVPDKFAKKAAKAGPNGPGLNDKGPWKDLPKEWKENMEAAKDEDLRLESSKVAFAEIANQTVRSADDDLKALKEQVSEAESPYRSATKANKLKQAYLRELLEARGKEPSAFDMGLQSRT